jgi:hypothetical protein
VALGVIGAVGVIRLAERAWRGDGIYRAPKPEDPPADDREVVGSVATPFGVSVSVPAGWRYDATVHGGLGARAMVLYHGRDPDSADVVLAVAGSELPVALLPESEEDMIAAIRWALLLRQGSRVDDCAAEPAAGRRMASCRGAVAMEVGVLEAIAFGWRTETRFLTATFLYRGRAPDAVEARRIVASIAVGPGSP